MDTKPISYYLTQADLERRAIGRLEQAQSEVERAINACPSGELRNLLTDVNIYVMQKIMEARQLL